MSHMMQHPHPPEGGQAPTLICAIAGSCLLADGQRGSQQNQKARQVPTQTWTCLADSATLVQGHRQHGMLDQLAMSQLLPVKGLDSTNAPGHMGSTTQDTAATTQTCFVQSGSHHNTGQCRAKVHLDMLRAVQEPLVEGPGALTLPVGDLKVDVGLRALPHMLCMTLGISCHAARRA